MDSNIGETEAAQLNPGFTVTYRPFRPIIGAPRSPVPPTSRQLALWDEIRKRLPELVKEAIASIPEPPADDLKIAPFHRSELRLKDISIELDNSFSFFFNPKRLIDECDAEPMIDFHNWKIVESYWAT